MQKLIGVSPSHILKTEDTGRVDVVEKIVNTYGLSNSHLPPFGAYPFAEGLANLSSPSKIKHLNCHWDMVLQNVIGKCLDVRELSREEVGELKPELLEKYPDTLGALWTKTHYLQEIPTEREAYLKLIDGQVDEFSVGFWMLEVQKDGEVVEFDWMEGDEPDGHVITKALLKEYSLVPEGANESTYALSAAAPRPIYINGRAPADPSPQINAIAQPIAQSMAREIQAGFAAITDTLLEKLALMNAPSTDAAEKAASDDDQGVNGGKPETPASPLMKESLEEEAAEALAKLEKLI